MRLYVPKEMQMPLDMKEGDYCPSLKEWLALQDVCECYQSFDEILYALAKGIKRTNVELRYPALKLKEIPAGSVGDWLIQVVNIFGDVAAQGDDHRVPASIDKPFLIARLCEEGNVTERVAKQRLITLMHGNYLQEEYGRVLFPVQLLARR